MKRKYFHTVLIFQNTWAPAIFYDDQNRTENFADKHKQNNNQAEWTYLTDKNIMYPTATG